MIRKEGLRGLVKPGCKWLPSSGDRLYTYGPVYPVGIMDISTLSLARAQFVTSLSFLALFLSVALALAWILLFFKLRARMSAQRRLDRRLSLLGSHLRPVLRADAGGQRAGADPAAACGRA